ncbi:MAG: PEGA domain-containing protein [Labilithrix sp.]|nr:PEGA domain-containing protein [Labilithrix sp.]MCW5814331.1 PEGA domain-containing protein [Labilithrix sp.]
MRFLRVCAFGLAALFWQVTAAAAPPQPAGPIDPAGAREQLKIGYGLAQEGKCAEALPHLLESLRLDARAITLLNLADCEEKTGKLTDALVHWADARARAAAEGQRPIEEEASARAAALEPKMPRLTIVLASTAPPDATVERDGIALGSPSLGVPLPLDPGPHTITVKARGHEPASKEVTLAEGEKQTIEVEAGPALATPPPPPPPKLPVEETKSGGMSPLVPIGFGVGAVGIIAGTITGLMTLSRASEINDACPNKQCRDSADRDNAESAQSLGTVSTVAFIVGGVGAAVGVVGLLTGGKKTEPKVDVGFGPTNLVLRGRF